MCSRPGAEHLELAAGDGDGGEVGGGLDAVGHGAVVAGSQRAALDARRSTMRDEPMPSMSAPIATSISQRSTTSGSRAALSITVVPVGEHGRGDDVLGRPDARERRA